jgi:hypothetical protein
VIEFSLVTALLAGLLGGVHCAGMCGGIVAAFSFRPDGRTPPFRLHLAYNAGRVMSYTLFGALAGALGSALALAHFLPVQTVLYGLAQIVMILLGLYLAGLSKSVLVFERAGSADSGHDHSARAHRRHGVGLAAVRAGVFGVGVGTGDGKCRLWRGIDAGVWARNPAKSAGYGTVCTADSAVHPTNRGTTGCGLAGGRVWRVGARKLGL